MELTEIIRNLQTGGNKSFCYFFWGHFDQNHIGPVLSNDFDYPQYLHEISLINLGQLSECQEFPSPKPGYITIDYDCYMSSRTIIKNVEIPPKQSIHFEDFKVPIEVVKGIL